MHSRLQLKIDWSVKTVCPQSDDDEENVQQSKIKTSRLVSSRWSKNEDGTQVDYDSADEEWGESFKLVDAIQDGASFHFELDRKLDNALGYDKEKMMLLKIIKNSLDVEILLQHALNPSVLYIIHESIYLACLAASDA